MSNKPLFWLDNFEENMKGHLLRDFRTKVNLLESVLDLVAEYIGEIVNGLPRFEDTKDLYSGGRDRLSHVVSGLLLYEALVRLYAARRLLLCGYQARMLACLRDMWEAVYYSDICLQSESMAKKWLDGAYLPNPQKLTGSVEVQDRVQKYRGGKWWDFFSRLVHPTRLARERDVLYKAPVGASLSVEAETMFKDISELHELEKEQTFINIWIAIFAVRSFLGYLRDVYSSIYKNNSVIYSDIRRLDARFRRHLVILERHFREE